MYNNLEEKLILKALKTQINKIKLLKRLILLLLVILSITFFMVNRKVKQYGYTGVWDVISTYNKNKSLSKKVKPTIIQLNIEDKDYDFLKKRRQIALDRGLQINDGNNYVPCKVIVDDEEVKGEMRLKGHMTDHLQEDKWSFRVKTKQNVLGMYRFSLQHPGTRNYVYEWIYHQLLKNEGIIYLNYDFVNVKLNDKDLGIYAMEEHFGQHVLEHNNRPKGAIIRWNPQLYWEWRIDEFAGIYLNEEYSSYQSSFAEPYDKGKVLKDEALIENYQTAVDLLEQFRRGIKTTSQVFDVEKMARFHAIIDLVGGEHSLDWSDVKFYYNSDTKRIEPVGYESFSIRETHQIAGQQIYNNYDSLQFNYHAQLFEDPVFFEAYISNLERIANEAYMHQFISKIQPELDEKIGIIANEWAYRKFDFDGYFENIKLIKNNLNLPKPFHAFINQKTDSSIIIDVAPVSDFPIEILSLKNGKNSYSLNHPFVLPPKARETYIHFYELTFNGAPKKLKGLTIEAKIPGYSKTFEIEVAPYSYFNNKSKFDTPTSVQVDTSVFTVKDKNLFLKEETTTIHKTTTVPKEYTLIINPNQTLELKDTLWVNGTIKSNGLSDYPVLITSNHGQIILDKGTFQASQTNFTGNSIFTSVQSKVLLNNCMFYDLDRLIIDSNSDIIIENCKSGSLAELGEFDQSDVNLLKCNFNRGKEFCKSKSSMFKLIDCKVNNYEKFAFLNHASILKMWRSNINQTDKVFSIKNSSSIHTFGGEILNYGTLVNVEENSPYLQGESTYNFYKTNTKKS